MVVWCGVLQEATKFKAAMADPAFQSMLRDYMEEMQDPANRAVRTLTVASGPVLNMPVDAAISRVTRKITHHT